MLPELDTNTIFAFFETWLKDIDDAETPGIEQCKFQNFQLCRNQRKTLDGVVIVFVPRVKKTRQRFV